jgi:kumamolisin
MTRSRATEVFGATDADLISIQELGISLGLEVLSISKATRIVRLLSQRKRVEHMLPALLEKPCVQHIFGFDVALRARPRLIKRHPFMAAMPAELVAGAYAPREVAELYNFPPDTSCAGECIGIINFGCPPSQADLDAFFEPLGRPSPPVKVIDVVPNGRARYEATEITMAIQIAGSVAHCASFVVYQSTPTELGWIEAVRFAVYDEAHRPSTLLIPWGWPEEEWSEEGIHALEEAFQEAAEIGMTVICASGNNGSVGDVDDGACHVDFPAASHFVLTCGGTSLRSLRTLVSSEVVWNNGPLGLGGGGSGGGVSTRIAQPAWQRGAGVPISQTGYEGRGLPDVAANADPNTGYRVILQGESEIVGGTSAASALWAAVIACINATARIRVGFLNPLLYLRLPASNALRDVVVGSNDTSGSTGQYPARHGWNAATGWGSMDGIGLLEALTPHRGARTSLGATRSLGRRWQVIPGLAFDVASADNGSVWVVSTLPTGSYGSGIYHWNGATWESIPGGGRRITVSQKRVYATIATSRMLIYQDGVWTPTSVFAHDIAACADGSVWLVGTEPIAGGFPIYHWSRAGQRLLPSKGAIRIAVDPQGFPWVITWQMEVFRWTAFGWQSLPSLPRQSALVPGEGVDIGIGANGSVWVVTNPPTQEPSIFHWNGRSWDAVEGAAVATSVRPDGLPWIVTPYAEIYVRV